MSLRPPLRKAILLTHILSSVGWFGAVATFLVLAIVGLRSSNPAMVRAVYMAMEPATVWIIVPSAVTSLATGLLLALGTPWGLFRHYWIIFKLLISGVSLPVLLLHLRIIRRVAEAPVLEDRIQLVFASALALAALFLATVLSVFKPRGVIKKVYG